MLSAGTLLSLFQGSDTAVPVRGTAADAGRAMPPASRQSSAAPRARVFAVDFMVRVPLWVL